MPQDLFKAHKLNDVVVMEAYEFDWRKISENDCVAELMKMYQGLIEKTRSKEIIISKYIVSKKMNI